MRRGPVQLASTLALAALGAAALLACVTAMAAPAGQAGISPEELVQLGRQLYREGRLASGEPVRAVVLGDVLVEGTQFTCLHCHRQSGLGGSEGRIRVLPTDGASLFQGRTLMYRSRPAYTDASLARLIRHGEDSGGQPLDPLMPRFQLPDLEMNALIAYLKTLSVEYSPGVTEDQLHLATVVAGDVDPAKRSAMLAVLNEFLKVKNGETRAETRRAQAGPFFEEYMNKAYRKWVLHVWEVKGPESTWRSQLQEEYRKQPVFAVLSGLSSLAWKPVHQFCEDLRLPCVLPNVDAPPRARDGDFYTLYFSKGVSLEAELILSGLGQGGVRSRVLQVYRHNSLGEAAAATLRGAAGQSGTADVVDVALTRDEPFPRSRLDNELRGNRADTLVLWLDSADPALLGLTGWTPRTPVAAYLSSTLLNSDLSAVPAAVKHWAKLVHPFALPGDFEARVVRERAWFRSRGIDFTPETLRIEAQTYFACRILGEALMHVKRNFYRDYLLDSMDHFERMAVFTAVYPRLSFGPSQRYLAKGGYLVTLGDADSSISPERASWIVP